ncbi:MAG: nuclear transport factor 2 family protein [Raineya sp.]|jgi:hypothetical protein|nr:nuclear transport factor 2 family protein [Raineya sp.]
MISTLSLVITLFLSSFTPTSKKESDVIARSNKLDSLIIKHRSGEAEKFYAESFVLTTSTGKKKNKTDILKDIANEEIKWEINHTSEIEVRILDKTAILTGILHQKGKFMGKDFEAKLLVTDTWVLRNNEWILLAGHASVLPNK